MAKAPIKYYKIDPWAIIEEGFDPARARVSESIFSLSNEYLGTRGYFEEGFSGNHLQGVYFNCLYDMMDIQHDQVFRGLVSRAPFMANTVDWLYTRITLDGERLDLARSKFSEFVRVTDFRKATLTRSFVWETTTGKKTRISFVRFLSMKERHLAGQRITFQPLNHSSQIQVELGLDFNTLHEIAEGWFQVPSEGGKEFKPHGKCLWKNPRSAQEDGSHAIMAQTLSSDIRLLSAFQFQAPGATDVVPNEREKYIGVSFSLPLRNGEVSTVDKTVAFHWEIADDAKAWKTGMEIASVLRTTSFDAALADNIAQWDTIWRTLDIAIDGDDEIQQGVRYCLFQYYQSYYGADDRTNILCKGTTGEVYYGWVFWDTESYCIPVYLFMNPHAARKLLQFRYNQLPEAMRRAKDLGCKGARIPFTTITGYEACGTWQHVDLEVHAGLALAYAVWLYSKIMDDREFLYKEGIEMLVQISRYFATHGEYSPRNGDFGIYGVMGPDEFHMMVNNNCYTNVMAKKCFENTVAVLDEMRKKSPKAYVALTKKINLARNEPGDWGAMARKMRIPYDKKTGLYEQHDGFFDLPPVDARKIPADEFPVYKHWPYIKIFRYNMIKQPDFLLLPFFYSRDYSIDSKFKNYEYYEKVCSHESSLSPSIHSILAAELGKHKQAYDFFMHTSRLDLDDYNRNTDQGLHVTAMSGVWLNIVNGFAGMRTDGPVLSFQPTIPQKWKSYSFGIRYKGAAVAISVSRKSAVFQVTEGPGVTLSIYGKKHTIGSREVVVALQGVGTKETPTRVKKAVLPKPVRRTAAKAPRRAR